MAFRLKLLPTLFTIPAIIAMLALGSWQLERLSWKLGLIEMLDVRTSAQPIPLDDRVFTQNEHEFTPVYVEGQLDYSHELLLQNRTYDKNAGMHVLTPFVRADGKGVILVDRGWVPFDASSAADRLGSKIEGQFKLEGIIRFPGGQTSFVPNNIPEKEQWYFIDLDAIAGQIGQPLTPYYVMAKFSGDKDSLPIGGQWNISLPNNHLEYAATWYCLAFILFVIFILYHRNKK